MKLVKLHAENFRNIEETTITLDPALNVFSGRNGSGKTSLLEAVNFLGSGKSFRGSKIDPLTRHGSSYTLVSGEVQSSALGLVTLGFRRETSGERKMRLNGANQLQASELARHLPTLMLGPHSVDLLLGPPPERRSFLNRGVFHVEHGFSEIWRQGVRALQQRNALLRAEAREIELEPWTEQLAKLSTQIDDLRQAYFERFLPVFSDTYRFLLDTKSVKCSYRRGWDKERDLLEVFWEQADTDRQRHFTHSGFQRADIRFTIDGKSVADTCSRGELKLIAWSAVLAQGVILSETEDTSPVFLVDDLTAELDADHQSTVAELLENIGGQVLVTGTDPNRLKSLWNQGSTKMFHVEQGSIRELEKTNE
jgi:DNA replication and repair protein RecF